MKTNKSSVSELKQSLKRELEPHLQAQGFRLTGQRFERYHRNVLQIVHLMFIEHPAERALSFGLNLAVRHDDVENFINSWRSDLSIKEAKKTATIGSELGNLMGGGQKRWTVRRVIDCKKAANDAVACLTSCGFAYLKQYSDLMKVAERFTSDNPDEWHQLEGGRALRMPVIYAILGKHDLARNAFIVQNEYLKSIDDLHAADYPDFVAVMCRHFKLVNPLKG